MSARYARSIAALLSALVAALALCIPALHTHPAGPECCVEGPHVHSDSRGGRLPCACAAHGCDCRGQDGLTALPEAGDDPECPACAFLRHFRLTTAFDAPPPCMLEPAGEPVAEAPVSALPAAGSRLLTARSPPA